MFTLVKHLTINVAFIMNIDETKRGREEEREEKEHVYFCKSKGRN